MLNHLLIICTIVLCNLFAVGAHAKPKVLLIESYHSEYVWDIESTSGLESVLNNKVELLNFQMDTKRIQEDKYAASAEAAWEYYLKTKPDVVVLADDNALKYLGSRFIDTETPVVYMGINNNPRKYIPLNRNITGVLERPLYKRTIKYLNDILQLGHKKILILLDKSTTTVVFKESVFKSSNCITVGGIVTDIKLISSFSKWKEIVLDTQKEGYGAIVIGLYHRVFENAKYVDSEEVLEWTSANTPVPLFAFWAMSVGKGKAIGGMVISGEEQGKAAGLMVLDIIGGKPVQKIRPAIPQQGKFLFSRHELGRWKIRLPYKIKEQTKFLD